MVLTHTYKYVENISKKIVCDETLYIMRCFSFLVKDYNFKFDKIELGDMKDVAIYVKASVVDITTIIDPLIAHDLVVT